MVWIIIDELLLMEKCGNRIVAGYLKVDMMMAESVCTYIVVLG